MKVTAMRDSRDLRSLLTVKLFSDLKAYEFEMKEIKDEKEEESKTRALVSEPRKSRSTKKSINNLLTDEQFAMFVMKFKRFMKKEALTSKKPYNLPSRRQGRPQSSKDIVLCYNYRQPGMVVKIAS
ncbi:unnamed protein product [Cuscuta epithymum]|uniref:Uncharacterized protein n=1 Tax=Cuscuta epithymum TaxID=186058 RepID=A0AAV0FXA2_9ASTE|nr:unnamed protein product [Cuscuta epithymum]